MIRGAGRHITMAAGSSTPAMADGAGGLVLSMGTTTERPRMSGSSVGAAAASAWASDTVTWGGSRWLRTNVSMRGGAAGSKAGAAGFITAQQLSTTSTSTTPIETHGWQTAWWGCVPPIFLRAV